ncbi:MAG TPA: hypothetical protein VHW01_10805 [Polyangiaceae bacterium]|nr:hypothetical protein [Polyangiaceae bacterium]
MSGFSVPVRALRSSLWIAMLSAVACGGHVFESSSGAGGGGAGSVAGFTVTPGAGSGDAGGSAGSVAGAGAPAAGADPAGAPSGGQASAAGAGGTTNNGGSVGAAGSSAAAGVSSAGAGGTDDTQACTSSSQCEVVPKSCCSCGTGPVSSYTAINSKFESQYESHCGAVDCGACVPTPFDPNNPVSYYVATCQPLAVPLPSGAGGAIFPGHCVVVDLRATDVTACKSTSDCSLRGGAGCCSNCGGGAPIAINSSQEPELETMVCGDAPPTCNACLPMSVYETVCSAGRCTLELAPEPGPVQPPCSPQQPCAD